MTPGLTTPILDNVGEVHQWHRIIPLNLAVESDAHRISVWTTHDRKVQLVSIGVAEGLTVFSYSHEKNLVRRRAEHEYRFTPDHHWLAGMAFAAGSWHSTDQGQNRHRSKVIESPRLRHPEI